MFLWIKDYPIGRPPDFVGKSDDRSDHYFCGVGIDDANSRVSEVDSQLLTAPLTQ